MLAAVTPKNHFVKSLRLVDQTIEEFPLAEVQPGDLVGISIHTFNGIHEEGPGRSRRLSRSDHPLQALRDFGRQRRSGYKKKTGHPARAHGAGIDETTRDGKRSS